MKAIVIVAQSLHLGYLGCYGNEWIATPTLDQLAAEGIVFDQHYADCPDPAGARRAWRTGHYRLPIEDGESALGPLPDLLSLLRDQDIASVLVSSGQRFPAAEFTRGWDHVCPVPEEGEGTLLERSLESAVAALDLLADCDNWLIWIELDCLLPPWELPEEYRARYLEGDAEDEEEEPLTPLTDPVQGWLHDDDTIWPRLQCTYAAAVTYFDTGLGLLLDELRERNLDEGICLLVTSDRGHALGEHGIISAHRPWLHEELVHLPLIVRWGDRAEAGGRVAALTQTVDLMPTLLALFSVAAPTVHGHSLLPFLRGGSEPIRSYACSGLRIGAALEWALRTPDWAFLLPLRTGEGDPPRPPQLYVKPDDRWEVNNVLQHHLELAEHMEATLRGFVTATCQPGPLQPPPLRDAEVLVD